MIRDDKLYIHEDVTDWKDEALRDERIIKTDDDIMAELEGGTPTAVIARAAVVSRLLGKAPEELLRPNKVLIQVGAQQDVIAKGKQNKRAVETEHGTTYYVPALIGSVPTKDEKNPTVVEPDTDEDEEKEIPYYVTIDNPDAKTRAERYLQERIPGYIWNRLLIVYETGGDVRNQADILVQTIHDMVEKIV